MPSAGPHSTNGSSSSWVTGSTATGPRYSRDDSSDKHYDAMCGFGDIQHIDVADLPYIGTRGLRFTVKCSIPSRMLVASCKDQAAIPVEHPEPGDVDIRAAQHAEQVVDTVAVRSKGVGQIDRFAYRLDVQVVM